MGDVLVWAKDLDHTFELVTAARELAQSGKVLALALGDQPSKANELAQHGVDKVYTNDHETLKALQVGPYTDAVQQAIQKLKPAIVLIGSTIRAKDVAARVAARLEVGCLSDASNLRIESGRVIGDRPYYSGNSILTERLTKDPQIVVVPSRAYEAAPTGGTGAVEKIDLNLSPPKAQIAGVETPKAEGVHLEDADIVVSVGRGVKKKEDIAMVNDLANAIGGVVGCTRPIAADLKWLGDEHWIGLSGHEVKPKAYIGLGVSGQIQHVAGMRGSKLIVAINKDEEAPLVKISDYAIVDDLYKVLPALTREIRKLKGSG